MATTSVMPTPVGNFRLSRYPARGNEALQAWCSADLLLLEEVHRSGISGRPTLVVNDAYGALCVALQPLALWTDSALSSLAMQRNARANSRTGPPVLWSTQSPPATAELVVMRVPKLRPYFEYQLSRLARSLPPGATVLAAGMDKHLSPHTAQLLERWIGPTERFRGERKARLFRAVRDERATTDFPLFARYHCEPLAFSLQAMPNVFSRERLDGGTRFLLQYLSRLPPVQSAIDLACGNGVLGLFAAKQALAQSVVFCDESAMAIASSRANAEALFPQSPERFSFHHGDGLRHFAGAPAQLMLCNPPFHQEHTVNDFAGRHLLSQCNRFLQPGGRLCLVANRHLDYSSVLRREFPRIQTCTTDARFTILMAHKD